MGPPTAFRPRRAGRPQYAGGVGGGLLGFSTMLRHQLMAGCLAVLVSAQLAAAEPIRPRARLASASFSLVGQTLYALGVDGQVHVFDCVSGEETGRLGDHVSRFAVSGDGRFILASGTGGARLYQAATSKALRRLGEADPEARALSLSEDGAVALIAADNGSVRVFNAQSGALLGELAGHKERVNCIAVSPDGALAVTGSGNTTASGPAPGRGGLFGFGAAGAQPERDFSVRIWNVKEFKVVNVASYFNAPLESVRFSKQGRFVQAISDRNSPVYIDVASGKAKLPPLEDVLPAGRWTADRSLTIRTLPANPAIVKATDEAEVRPLAGPIAGFAVAWGFSQDGTKLLLATRLIMATPRGFGPAEGKVNPAVRPGQDGGKLYLFNVAAGAQAATLEGHTRQVAEVVFSADDRFAVSRDVAGDTLIWPIAP